uniref:SNF2-related protein n=1 Tax=uncultured marine thaumarchaeote KM3_95_D02 TaxID=1456347 RepID=A0A075I4K7_9ARCH|nr:SNF2-related protein [uncultured marine thaumarchaeote KM3_95_D02]
MVIADESHHFKNFLSERATALLQLAHHAKKRMILTGTMMPKELNDLYSQFTFLYPDEEILDDFEQFKFKYPQEEADSLIDLSQTLSPFFTRISKQALQLPEQTFNPPIVLEMNPIQQRIYDVLADNIRRNDPGYRQDVVLLNEWRRRAIVFLIEAATDPSLLPTTNQFTENNSYKTDGVALDELLQNYEELEGEFPKKLETTLELAQQTINNNGKVIIWCSFIHTINKLAKLFEKQNTHAIEIYGQIPKDDEEDENDNREKRLEKFKTNDDYNVLIANPASLAESVSLHHECHHAIYLDRTFNGGHYMQSLERIHRVGLDPKAVTRYDVLQSAMSIDQVISDRLGLKKRRLEEFLNSADLETMRFQQEDTSKDFANPVGEEGELAEDFDAVLDHIDRDVKDF